MKRDLARRIMSLPVRAKLKLVWRMFRDSQVPLAARTILPVVALYVAMPFDIIPDFIPVLGQLDDLLVIALGLSAVLWLTPRRVVEAHLLRLE